MAAAVASGPAKASSWVQLRNSSKMVGNNAGKSKKFRVSCVYSSVRDPYRTLSIHPGASESEVKKAFRQLALQYHPDVCKGSNCSVKFHEINDAYDMVMTQLREERERGVAEEHPYDVGNPDWDLWEEWMGWEGAGIRDYSSHINPYI